MSLVAPDRPGRKNNRNQEDIIRRLVDHAVGESSRRSSMQLPRVPSDSQRVVFLSLSRSVEQNFGSDHQLKQRLSGDDSCYIDHYVGLYCQNFLPLWSMIPRYKLNISRLHPILYLVMSSIGAMYAQGDAAIYGTLMHEKLREVLTSPLLELTSSDADALSIGIARALTQVAALYFGHRRAFSYAHKIGGVLLAQARRMDLFSSRRSLRPPRLDQMTVDDKRIWVDDWLHVEGRKRLAYALLRLGTYTSVLLSSRPLVSSEELELTLPCSSDLWDADFESDSSFILAVTQNLEKDNSTTMLFSDVVHVALEGREPLPALSMLGEELLMFALQEAVWRTRQEQKTLKRLLPNESENFDLDDGLGKTHSLNRGATGDQEMAYRLEQTGLPNISSANHIASQTLRMSELRRDQNRMIIALRHWHDSSRKLVQVGTTGRASVVSCLLLYHLSYLQLHAPIDTLHNISYRMEDEYVEGVNDAQWIRDAWHWSRRGEAKVAAQHAAILYELLRRELQEPPQRRARFNFLTHISLHHAATVIWAYAGTRSMNEEQILVLDNGTPNGIRITKPTTPELMNAFVELFRLTTPAWCLHSSFMGATKRLSTTRFPAT